MKKWLLCSFILILHTHYAFSQNYTWDLHQLSGASETLKSGLFAVAAGQVVNWTFSLFNQYIYGAEWGLPNRQSVQRNFTSAWKWEADDDFVVNQLGHSVMGFLHYAPGRASGFGFYQSVFFSAFGSAAWELYGERNLGSINDFITSTIGGMAPGEIFYRLYLEANAAGLPGPLIFFFNPMVGLQRLLTSWEPPNTGRNMYEFRVHTGIGFAETNFTVSENEENVFYFRGFFPEIGFRAVYGNPFEQETWVPFRHFEIDVAFGMDLGNYNHLRIISDGYLFSFSPVYTETTAMSTGLTLNFDIVTMGQFGMEDATIDQYSNALNWTIKYQRFITPETTFQMKLHNGFTFFGVSKYYAGIEIVNPRGSIKTGYNNFGLGLNSKSFFILDQNRWGRFEASFLCYALWTIPGTTYFSRGSAYWIYSDFSYSRALTRHVSMGLSYFYAMEWGFFNDGFMDQKKSNEIFKLFVAWNF